MDRDESIGKKDTHGRSVDCHKQLCLTFNSAIRRMTNQTGSIKMVAMKRLFPLSLMGLGFLIIIATGGYWIFDQKIQNPTSAPLPRVVAGLPLDQTLTAGAALAEFSQLHNEDFPLTSGAVGMYGPEHSITLWVAGAPLQLITDRLLVSMREKIASSTGSSPFSPVGERQDRSRTIYELDGMGQKHFYFQSGKLIIWMAVDPQTAEEALSQVLAFYP